MTATVRKFDPEINLELYAVKLVQAVARRWRVCVDDIFSKCRDRRAAWPRQEAYALVYALFGSLTETGRFFERDHKTVLHGIRRHMKRLGEMNGAA